MNFDKVVSGFFIILAMTLNFGFFYGDLTDITVHSKFELLAAVIVNLIATVLKLGDKTQMGSVLLATSLVAVIQLVAASTIWTIGAYVYTLDRELVSLIISLTGGALAANIISVVLYIGDTLKSKR